MAAFRGARSLDRGLGAVCVGVVAEFDEGVAAVEAADGESGLGSTGAEEAALEAPELAVPAGFGARVS